MESLTKPFTKITAVVILLMLLIDVGRSSCTTPEEDEMGVEELMYYSDVVVLGKLVRRFPKQDQAQIKVFCIYKGQNVPRMINISAQGSPADPCNDGEMEEGELYIAYLYKHDDNLFTPAFPHHPGSYVDEMYVVCDLNVSKPSGPMEPGDSEVQCEDDRSEPEDGPCVRYTPKPGESPHKRKKAPYQPGKTEKVERDSERDGNGSGSGNPAASIFLSAVATVLAASVCIQLS